jgi:hypothetical protein
VTKNSSAFNINIGYDKQIASSTSTKFLGLIIDNMLSWKSNFDWLMSILNSACYVIIAVKTYMSQETLRMIYFCYVHSVMNYGIIFWGNSPHSIHIFRLQKKIIRIITNSSAKFMQFFRSCCVLLEIYPWFFSRHEEVACCCCLWFV